MHNQNLAAQLLFNMYTTRVVIYMYLLLYWCLNVLDIRSFSLSFKFVPFRFFPEESRRRVKGGEFKKNCMNALLPILFELHIYWGYLLEIFKMVYNISCIQSIFLKSYQVSKG